MLQVGTLAGGPTPQFTYPSTGCRNMKDSHAGMKVSMQDFNDLAGHLVAALAAAKVAQADIDAIVAAVVPDGQRHRRGQDQQRHGLPAGRAQAGHPAR